MTRFVHTTASALILRTRPEPGAATDTGKRLLAGQSAVSLGDTFDHAWQFVTAPDGSGWGSSAYLADGAPAPAAHALYTLDGEDPELTANLAKLADLADDEGIAFKTADFGGVRTQADTLKILEYRKNDYAVYVRQLAVKKPGAVPRPIEEWRPIAPFGSSYHNFGCARDLKITERPASFTDAMALARLGALAPSCGLTWGGTFSDRRNDPPHFQLQITLAGAKARFEARA